MVCYVLVAPGIPQTDMPIIAFRTEVLARWCHCYARYVPCSPRSTLSPSIREGMQMRIYLEPEALLTPLPTGVTEEAVRTMRDFTCCHTESTRI